MQKTEAFVKIGHGLLQALTIYGQNSSESRLFWVIIAYTLGFNKPRARIALADFASATGLYENQSYDSLKKLAAQKMIIITKVRSSKGKKSNKSATPYYEINPDYHNWVASGKKARTNPQSLGLGVYRHIREAHRSKVTAEVPALVQPVEVVQAVQRVEIVQPTTAPESDTTALKNQATRYQKSSKGILKIQCESHQNFSDLYKEIYKENNTRDNSLNTRSYEERLADLILYSSQECGITIIGDNVGLLEQLMAVKTEAAIQAAIQNFKKYHETPKGQRQFTLAKDFKSFVRKIDIFSDSGALDMLLQNECRWFQESRGGQGALGGRRTTSCPDGIREQQPESGMEGMETAEQKERARIEVLRDYVEHIDRGAREKGVTVEQLLAGYVEPLRKYYQFKNSIHQFENAQRTV